MRRKQSNDTQRIKRIWLVALYTVVLMSILFAFPKTWGDKGEVTTFSSAPETPTFTLLPVRIVDIVKRPDTPTNTWQESPTSWSIVGSWTTKPLIPRKTTMSCAEIGVCEKIRFADGYTSAQKVKYYTPLLQTLTSLTNTVQLSPTIAESTYSITLSPENNERRWRGGSKTIILQTKNIATIQEFREVLTHEIAHIVDLGMLVWSSTTKDTKFTISNLSFPIDDPSLLFYKLSRSDSATRLTDSSYLDFVGWYAMSSPYEDFAETFALYMWYNDLFKQRTASSPILKKKYEFMDQLTQKRNLSASKTPQKTITRRPRDVTRMSLE